MVDRRLSNGLPTALTRAQCKTCAENKFEFGQMVLVSVATNSYFLASHSGFWPLKDWLQPAEFHSKNSLS